MNVYQEQILDHYKNPRNFGKPDWNATFTQKVQNISCGDSIELFIKIEDDEVKDIAFAGEGCSIAIASASLMTEELKGKTLNCAKNFSFDTLQEILGIPLTVTRQKCAYLPFEALKKALENKPGLTGIQSENN